MDNDQAPDTTIYGCIIYNNGWWGPRQRPRTRTHGIYAQNADDSHPSNTGQHNIQQLREQAPKVYAEGGHMQGETISCRTTLTVMAHMMGCPVTRQRFPVRTTEGGAT